MPAGRQQLKCQVVFGIRVVLRQLLTKVNASVRSGLGCTGCPEECGKAGCLPALCSLPRLDGTHGLTKVQALQLVGCPKLKHSFQIQICLVFLRPVSER